MSTPSDIVEAAIAAFPEAASQDAENYVLDALETPTSLIATLVQAGIITDALVADALHRSITERVTEVYFAGLGHGLGIFEGDMNSKDLPEDSATTALVTRILKAAWDMVPAAPEEPAEEPTE